MTGVDLSNPYVRKLKKYIVNNFINPPKDFFQDILAAYDDIINKDEIDISKIIRPKVWRGKTFSVQDRVDHLVRKNNKRLQTGTTLIVLELKDEIVSILKSYKTYLSTAHRQENTRGFVYKNAEEDLTDEDLIMPGEATDLTSIKLNLFYNKDVNYSFNETIEPAPLDPSSSTLQALKLKINGVLEHNIVPIKRKAICTEKKDGVECGNIVHFSDVHLNSTIRCTDSGCKGTGHKIKKLEKAIVEESRIWYTYEGCDLLSDNSTEIIICSLIPLNHNILTVNAIFVNDESSHYVLVISAKAEKIKPLEENILLHHTNSIDFLDDIYKSLQKYLEKYHNITLNNQNKIVGHVIIFMILNNLFYKKRMNSLIVGKSGSGKTIWVEWLIPLFTLNYKTVLGTDITRNKFVGGRSNLISSMMNSLFSAGYIATQDIIFAEECTNSLKDFQDPKVNQNNNIFHLIKACSGREVDVAIQGGQKVYPKASSILVGNLEQLEFTHEYKSLVASKYRKLKEGDDRDYKEKWPLFKPIGYYIHILKNIKLAEAHSIIRQNWRGIAGNNYITRLPPAEQARYNFMLVLEDDLDNQKTRREMKKESILSNPKREYFIKELSAVFMNEDGTPKECPYSLKKQINDYFNDEFYDSRHNFRHIFGVDRGLNAHIENNIVMIMEQLVWMNKLYNQDRDMNLTSHEKDLIRYFLSFNYNVLGKKEASMSVKPYINDFADLKKDTINVDLKSKEDYWKKVEQDKDKLNSLIDGAENLL